MYGSSWRSCTDPLLPATLSEPDVCVLLVVDDRARSPVALRLLGIAPGGKVGQRTVAARAHVEHARVSWNRGSLPNTPATL